MTDSSDIDQGEIIFSKLMEILAYAGDVIIGRSLICIKAAFQRLDYEAYKIGLN